MQERAVLSVLDRAVGGLCLEGPNIELGVSTTPRMALLSRSQDWQKKNKIDLNHVPDSVSSAKSCSFCFLFSCLPCSERQQPSMSEVWSYSVNTSGCWWAPARAWFGPESFQWWISPIVFSGRGWPMTAAKAWPGVFFFNKSRGEAKQAGHQSSCQDPCLWLSLYFAPDIYPLFQIPASGL